MKIKRKKDLVSPSLTLGLGPVFPPHGLLSLPLSLSTARPNLFPGPLPNQPASRAPLLSSAAADRAGPSPGTPTGGTQLSEPSPTSCPGRTRARVYTHLSVFSPRGVTPTSKTSACSPFQMVMQEKTQRFILVRAREGPTSSGGGSVCIILHLSACTGVNTSWYGWRDEVW